MKMDCCHTELSVEKQVTAMTKKDTHETKTLRYIIKQIADDVCYQNVQHLYCYLTKVTSTRAT